MSELFSLLRSSEIWLSLSSVISTDSSLISSGTAPSSKTSSRLIVSSEIKFSSLSILISSPLIRVSASDSVRDTITEIIA